ncbi:MAG: hypothetical protein R3E79_19520 [Caldilineaceae bacterium]
MSEVFPIVAGVVIGLAIQWIAQPRQRTLVLVGLSLLAGFTASFISGELFMSWDFLLIDIPLVFLAAVVTHLLVRGFRRWQPLA